MTLFAKKKLLNLGATLWVSFLSAGVASTLFFATFDPALIAQIATYPLHLSRNTGYAIGFVLFWILLVINSVVVSFILRGNQASVDR